MKILIISDAWHPQVNGVVRTLESTAQELTRSGHQVRVVGPDAARLCTFALPSYPEIKLEFFAHRRLNRMLRDWNPDFVHIATEGPLGWTARRLCLYHGKPFTTSYHTRFPEYVAARLPRLLARPGAPRDLCFVAPFPCSSGRSDGGDQFDGTGIAGA